MTRCPRLKWKKVFIEPIAKIEDLEEVIIAEETWEQQGDIRDVISLSKLVKC